MSLNAPYTPNTVIQSTQVSNDLTGLANGTNDTANNSMSTFRSEVVLDHVASGCVWSGDSYASTRNASQTSGVVYIGGVRLTVSAVSARLFTASKDTYIDINGSGVQVYTEVTNNAASPALTAGNLRNGIIVTGATTIAAAGSVNQGQETIVLPIASSIAYSVTDSLGNLICCRDPLHRVLSYRQITGNVSGPGTTTPTQVAGLSCPVIVPTGRKIRITFKAPAIQNSTSPFDMNIGVWDGVVNSGTQLSLEAQTIPSNNYLTSMNSAPVTTPTSSSKTYNADFHNNSGTGTLIAAATKPAYLLVELL